jgi:hypothetical protein
MRDKFHMMYKRKVNTHHYTEFMDIGHFDETFEAVNAIIAKYEALENEAPKPLKRLKPLYI